jgi:hypothetical protein
MNTVLDNLLPLLVTILTPILIYFANKLINLLATKLQLSNVADLTSTIDGIITKAVQAAEEWALGKIDATPPPAPVPTPAPSPVPTAPFQPVAPAPVAPVAPTSADKMAMAKRVVEFELASKGLAPLDDEHVEALIQACMGRRRQRLTRLMALTAVQPAPAPAPAPVEIKKTPSIAEKIVKKG